MMEDKCMYDANTDKIICWNCLVGMNNFYVKIKVYFLQLFQDNICAIQFVIKARWSGGEFLKR